MPSLKRCPDHLLACITLLWESLEKLHLFQSSVDKIRLQSSFSSPASQRVSFPLSTDLNHHYTFLWNNLSSWVLCNVDKTISISLWWWEVGNTLRNRIPCLSNTRCFVQRPFRPSPPHGPACAGRSELSRSAGWALGLQPEKWIQTESLILWCYCDIHWTVTWTVFIKSGFV